MGNILNVLQLQQDMILVTCSGMNLGRSIWVRDELTGLCGTHDLIRVCPDPAKVQPGYVHAFLASRFGHAWIRKQIYGGHIKHVEPKQLATMPVPRLDSGMEERTHQLVVDAGRMLSQANRKLSRATDEFFASVGLQDITATDWHAEGPDLGFGTAFPQAKSFRALNFNPRFRQLCDRIRSGPWKPLGEICVPGTLKRGGRYKRVDAEPEYGRELISQKQLFRLRPRGRWVARKSIGDALVVENGTVLVAARGTLGESELYCRSELAVEPVVEKAYSEDILRVVADPEVMPRGCLYAFMRSETAFRQLRSISSGTKIMDHHYSMLPELPVPYPPQRVHKKIDGIVMDAYKARHKAVALEDEAISLVENAIKEAT